MLATLYAIAIAVLTIYGGNLLWMAATHANRDRLRPGIPPDPDALPDPPPSWPEVTVQLPVYNEPLVVQRLVDACARLDYPRRKLEIQILDDSTDETSELAADRAAFWQDRGIDVVHVRRDRRDGYKAGALQNGLQIARGDIIAVFDADFVPQSDFLRRTVPIFCEDDRIGVVQARWTHLNHDASWLTRIQTIGLDMHFAVEQRVRALTGCFLNFNGTAGLWRRSCIEDAGGWHGDTIAEDLDLSYRAQLARWRFRFLDDLAVPAELPQTMSALRAQQFRWAKGSVETARKLLPALWRSPVPRRIKLQGTIHLSAHAVFPFVLTAALLHAPLLMAKAGGAGPSEAYFGWMSFGLTGFVGFTLALLLAQRFLYPDWGRRIRMMPAFMVGTIGLSLNNSRAVFEALVGRRTPFIRTPKYGSRVDSRRSKVEARVDSRWSVVGGQSPRQETRDLRLETRDYRLETRDLPLVAWLEIALFLYCLAGLGILIALGEWAAVPFQLFFTAGFGLVIAATFGSVARPDSRYGRICSASTG